jgi:uncharacterized membrane protein
MSNARAHACGHGLMVLATVVLILMLIFLSSVCEIIKEKAASNQTSPAHSVPSKKSSRTTHQAIFVVESDTASIHSNSEESV